MTKNTRRIIFSAQHYLHAIIWIPETDTPRSTPCRWSSRSLGCSKTLHYYLVHYLPETTMTSLGPHVSKPILEEGRTTKSFWSTTMNTTSNYGVSYHLFIRLAEQRSCEYRASSLVNFCCILIQTEACCGEIHSRRSVLQSPCYHVD